MCSHARFNSYSSFDSWLLIANRFVRDQGSCWEVNVLQNSVFWPCQLVKADQYLRHICNGHWAVKTRFLSPYVAVAGNKHAWRAASEVALHLLPLLRSLRTYGFAWWKFISGAIPGIKQRDFIPLQTLRQKRREVGEF